jgi:hypothetical protein
VLGQHGAGVLVDLALPYDLTPDALGTEVEPANAREQAADPHFSRSAQRPPAPQNRSSSSGLTYFHRLITDTSM